MAFCRQLPERCGGVAIPASVLYDEQAAGRSLVRFAFCTSLEVIEDAEDFRRVRLSRLDLGEQFTYVFDLGDNWTHLCTVGTSRIDPVEALGIQPDKPLPYWGWGDIPDQYRRRWDGDDGESPVPPDPGLADLPPLRPHWGPDRPRTRPHLTSL